MGDRFILVKPKEIVRTAASSPFEKSPPLLQHCVFSSARRNLVVVRTIPRVLHVVLDACLWEIYHLEFDPSAIRITEDEEKNGALLQVWHPSGQQLRIPVPLERFYSDPSRQASPSEAPVVARAAGDPSTPSQFSPATPRLSNSVGSSGGVRLNLMLTVPFAKGPSSLSPELLSLLQIQPNHQNLEVHFWSESPLPNVLQFSVNDSDTVHQPPRVTLCRLSEPIVSVDGISLRSRRPSQRAPSSKMTGSYPIDCLIVVGLHGSVTCISATRLGGVDPDRPTTDTTPAVQPMLHKFRLPNFPHPSAARGVGYRKTLNHRPVEILSACWVANAEVLIICLSNNDVCGFDLFSPNSRIPQPSPDTDMTIRHETHFRSLFQRPGIPAAELHSQPSFFRFLHVHPSEGAPVIRVASCPSSKASSDLVLLHSDGHVQIATLVASPHRKAKPDVPSMDLSGVPVSREIWVQEHERLHWFLSEVNRLEALEKSFHGPESLWLEEAQQIRSLTALCKSQSQSPLPPSNLLRMATWLKPGGHGLKVAIAAPSSLQHPPTHNSPSSSSNVPFHKSLKILADLLAAERPAFQLQLQVQVHSPNPQSPRSHRVFLLPPKVIGQRLQLNSSPKHEGNILYELEVPVLHEPSSVLEFVNPASLHRQIRSVSLRLRLVPETCSSQLPPKDGFQQLVPALQVRLGSFDFPLLQLLSDEVQFHTSPTQKFPKPLSQDVPPVVVQIPASPDSLAWAALIDGDPEIQSWGRPMLRSSAAGASFGEILPFFKRQLLRRLLSRKERVSPQPLLVPPQATGRADFVFSLPLLFWVFNFLPPSGGGEGRVPETAAAVRRKAGSLLKLLQWLLGSVFQAQRIQTRTADSDPGYLSASVNLSGFGKVHAAVLPLGEVVEKITQGSPKPSKAASSPDPAEHGALRKRDHATAIQSAQSAQPVSAQIGAYPPQLLLSLESESNPELLPLLHLQILQSLRQLCFPDLTERGGQLFRTGSGARVPASIGILRAYLLRLKKSQKMDPNSMLLSEAEAEEEDEEGEGEEKENRILDRIPVSGSVTAFLEALAQHILPSLRQRVQEALQRIQEVSEEYERITAGGHGGEPERSRDLQAWAQSVLKLYWIIRFPPHHPSEGIWMPM